MKNLTGKRLTLNVTQGHRNYRYSLGYCDFLLVVCKLSNNVTHYLAPFPRYYHHIHSVYT